MTLSARRLVLLISGHSPLMAIFWATLVAYLASFANPSQRLGPRRLAQALTAGSTGAVNVAVSRAAAGIIAGIVTLTGLGLKFFSIVAAFVVPFMFVLDPAGIGLLLKGAPAETALTAVSAALGIAALAAGVQNWLKSMLPPVERVPLIAAGVLLAHPAPWNDAAGLALATIVGVLHWFRTRTLRTA